MKDVFQIRDDDLKQMFVYNHYYNTNLSILLYSKVFFSSDSKKPFYPYNKEYQELNCQLCFIDLFDENQKIKRELREYIYKEMLQNELLA